MMPYGVKVALMTMLLGVITIDTKNGLKIHPIGYQISENLGVQDVPRVEQIGVKVAKNTLQMVAIVAMVGTS